MQERNEAFEAAASGIAFMLLGAAFDRLAMAYRLKDPEAGHALLHDLQVEAVETLKRFAADRPAHVQTDILAEAAQRVKTVIRAAQGYDPDDE